MGKQQKQWQTIFLGSKITADSDCSQEIKVLLGREVVTNLDSVLKSRDITLLINAHMSKAMVFPVVMYGCESWTIKKAEPWRTVVPKTLESPLDCKIEPVNPKGNQPWIFIGKDPDAEEDWG